MTLGISRRDRIARRADKWFRSIYLTQMMMGNRGQVPEIIDKQSQILSYGVVPLDTDDND